MNHIMGFIDSNKMKIVVDTTFSLSFQETYWHYKSDSDFNKIVDSIRLLKSYPVIVFNESDSMLEVGRFNDLRVVRQVKNEAGDWQNIEVLPFYFCGTGSRELVIEPGWILIAKLLRYKGDFKTQCRLKYEGFKRVVYSNVFNDYIDKRQLRDTLQDRNYNFPTSTSQDSH